MKNGKKKLKKEFKIWDKKYTYGFQQFETIRSFSDNIYTGKITINEAERDQRNLLENMLELNYKSKSRSEEGRKEKEMKVHMNVQMLSLKIEN